MQRLQLALNVTDLDGAIAFYETLFATPVTKRKPGYANFAIEQPPLKLVLFEAAEGGTINHLGVETDATATVDLASDRLAAAGLITRDERDVTCCYSTQDKVWVTDPDGAPWEIYTVTDDAPAVELPMAGAGCCA